VIETIKDRETIEFVRKQASHAKYITSVCTGAFILGAAGLLRIGPLRSSCRSSERHTRRRAS